MRLSPKEAEAATRLDEQVRAQCKTRQAKNQFIMRGAVEVEFSPRAPLIAAEAVRESLVKEGFQFEAIIGTRGQIKGARLSMSM